MAAVVNDAGDNTVVINGGAVKKKKKNSLDGHRYAGSGN